MKSRSKSKMKNAISLIVLVVTILILGILATVVVISLSNGGIIGQAQDAVDKNNEAVNKEKNLFEKIEELLNGGSKEAKITDLIGNATTKNTEVTDEYGNKVVVPEGFKIVAHDNDTVKYTYSDSAGNIPTVQDGIVIEDATGGENNGTRFVWVPVGDIKNKDNTTTTISLENTTTEASMFSTDEGTVIQKTAYEHSVFDGFSVKFKKVASLSEQMSDLEARVIEYENDLALKEARADALAEIDYERDLDLFLTTTKENGGYYIAQNQIKTNDTINYQPDASKVAKELYGEVKDKNSNLICASDLINEYALCAAHMFFNSYSNGETDTKCNISQIQGFIIDHSNASSKQVASGINNMQIEKMAYKYSEFSDSEVKFRQIAITDPYLWICDMEDHVNVWDTRYVGIYLHLLDTEHWYDRIDSRLSGEGYIKEISNKVYQRFETTEIIKLAVPDLQTQIDDLNAKIDDFPSWCESNGLDVDLRIDTLEAWCSEKAKSGVRPILYVK